MNRFLCVWLRNWPVHRLVVEQPELRGKLVILHARDARQRQLVVACSSRAQALGVCVDMPLADAATLIEGRQFYVQPHDPDADDQTLTTLADWCNQFSPAVAADSPDSLLFDLNGVTHLYGCESNLMNHVIKEFRLKGYRPRVAIADTLGAAWAAAHYSDTSSTIIPEGLKRDRYRCRNGPKGALHNGTCPLLDLPAAALRIPVAALEKLDRLGIHRIRQLVELPRKNLPSRIGREVLERLDCLTGDKTETIVSYKPLPTFEQQWLLDQATSHPETISHIVHVLLERLANQLRCHSHGAMRLSVCFDCAGSRPVKIDIGLYRPSADASHLDGLAQMQLETTKIPAAVECVTVVAEETRSLEQLQRSLLAAESSSDPQEVADLIERLGSRLGVDRVVRAVPVDDWQPEKAFRYRPLTESVFKKGSGTVVQSTLRAVPATVPDPFLNTTKPLRMFFPPEPVDVISAGPDGPPAYFHYHGRQQVADFQGPERLETAWWRGASVLRDYYQVETEFAGRFWLFRRLDNGQWFLHGSFD